MNQFLNTATRQELQNLLESANLEKGRQQKGKEEFENMVLDCDLAINSLDRQIDALSALLRDDDGQ